MAQYNNVRKQILQTTTPLTATFGTVMYPLAQVENAIQGELAMVDMLQYGSPSLATQETFNEAHRLLVEAQASWATDEAIFKLLQAARRKPDFDLLDSESKIVYWERGC
ncbi:hypothetical protein BBP40_004245 [Aspergillus hancockii]|nr:hypothetical protein BBP40_004245 [Aspergillus hancockii]